MPEKEPKIMIYKGTQNTTKHLKWSRKERLAKNNYGLELSPGNITTYLTSYLTSLTAYSTNKLGNKFFN